MTSNGSIFDKVKPYLEDYCSKYLDSAHAGSSRYCCPLCGSGNGKDTAFKLYPNTHTWHCYACNGHGDVTELHRRREGFATEKEAAHDLAAIFNIPTTESPSNTADSCTPPRRQTMEPTPNTQTPPKPLEELKKKAESYPLATTSREALTYLQDHGINAETANKCGVKYQDGWIVFPRKSGYMTARHLGDKKHYKPQGLSHEPYLSLGLPQEGEPLFIVEGEADALALATHGAYAVACGGTGSVKQTINLYHNSYKLIDALDNDKPGREAAKKCSQYWSACLWDHLQDDISEVKDVADIARDTPQVLASALMKATSETRETSVVFSSRGKRVYSQTFDEFDPEETLFLHKDCIPLNGLTMFAGDGGSGKTTFALHIIARATQGTLDGEYTGKPCDVVAIFTEDTPGVVAAKLVASGAVLHRVHTYALGEDRDVPEFPDDIEGIVEFAKRIDAKLIVVDPVLNFMDGDSYKDSVVRKALKAWQKLLMDTGIAVILIHHSNKAATSAVNTVAGSKAFTTTCRIVWGFKKSENPGWGIMSTIKSNVTDIDGEYARLTFPFEKKDITHNGKTIKEVVYAGAPVITSEAYWDDDTHGYANTRGNKKESAINRIIETLSNSGSPIPRDEMLSILESEGIAKGTANRALSDLVGSGSIRSDIVGSGRDRKALYSLPKDEKKKLNTQILKISKSQEVENLRIQPSEYSNESQNINFPQGRVFENLSICESNSNNPEQQTVDTLESGELNTQIFKFSNIQELEAIATPNEHALYASDTTCPRHSNIFLDEQGACSECLPTKRSHP